MTDVEQTIGELTRAYDSLSPRAQAAAAFVLKNPSHVATRSMRRVAREAGVTPPTMLRMVNAIGFDRYEDFRDVYRNGYDHIAHVYGDRVRKLQMRKTGQDKDGSLWDALIDANQTNLQRLSERNSPATLTRAANRLLKAERVYVAGMLSSHPLAAYLHYVSRLALPNWYLVSARGEMLAEDIAYLGRKDAVIVIGFAPYATDTVRIARLARERKAAVIAITDDLTSPLAGQAEDTFVAPSESPQFFGSFVATLALIEALIAYVVSKADKNVLNNIANVEKVRKSLGDYYAASPRATR